jgi:hypothetical protein
MLIGIEIHFSIQEHYFLYETLNIEFFVLCFLFDTVFAFTCHVYRVLEYLIIL